MDHGSEKVVLREGDVQRALTRIAHEIAERNPEARLSRCSAFTVVGRSSLGV